MRYIPFPIGLNVVTKVVGGSKVRVAEICRPAGAAC